jgi:hypothetical protein
MPVRQSGAITHGAAAISFTARSAKLATMIHGSAVHRHLAVLEARVGAAGSEPRAVRFCRLI